MLLKLASATLLIGCLVWLYFDRSMQPVIGVIISSISLAFTLFKKDSSNSPSNNFNINSGEKSINNQTTGDINQNITHGTKK